MLKTISKQKFALLATGTAFAAGFAMAMPVVAQQNAAPYYALPSGVVATNSPVMFGSAVGTPGIPMTGNFTANMAGAVPVQAPFVQYPNQQVIGQPVAGNMISGMSAGFTNGGIPIEQYNGQFGALTPENLIISSGSTQGTIIEEVIVEELANTSNSTSSETTTSETATSAIVTPSVTTTSSAGSALTSAVTSSITSETTVGELIAEKTSLLEPATVSQPVTTVKKVVIAATPTVEALAPVTKKSGFFSNFSLPSIFGGSANKPAYTAAKATDYYLTGQTMLSRPSAFNWDNSAGAFPTTMKDGIAFIAAYGQPIGTNMNVPGLYLEGEASYRHAKLETTATFPATGSVSSLAGAINLRKQFFQASPLGFYVGTGVGLARLEHDKFNAANIDLIDSDIEMNVMFNNFAGLSYKITPRMKFLAEVRHVYMPDVTRYANDGVARDDDYATREIGLGMKFDF